MDNNLKSLRHMSSYESGLHEPLQYGQEVREPITDWREALSSNPELSTAFHALDPEGQFLITRRLDLQVAVRSAQEQLARHKAAFDELVAERRSGALFNVETIEQIWANQSAAYARCLGTTAAIIDVESHLCMRNLPSLPYLTLTLSRDGQALKDYPAEAAGTLPLRRSGTE